MANPFFCDPLPGTYSLPFIQFVDEWLKILPSRLKAYYTRVQKTPFESGLDFLGQKDLQGNGMCDAPVSCMVATLRVLPF